MPGLQSIKQRIGTVQSIRKITHAMELVAASKLRKARVEYESVKSYSSLVEDAFYSILKHLPSFEREKIFPKHTTGRNLYIVLTGDLGLAGSYNSNVIKLAKKIINPEDKVVVVGTKGINGLDKLFAKQYMLTLHSEEPEGHYKMVQKIMKIVLKCYNANKIDSINVIYNKYINNLVQEEHCMQIFPFKNNDNAENKTLEIIEFEPSPEEVLNEAIPFYISAQVYNAYTSSKLSELASRRSAMETATNNANDLINDLHIKYNRRRQSNITQELNEIVAGANAV